MLESKTSSQEAQVSKSITERQCSIANVIPLFVCKEAERDTVAALPMWRGRTGFPAFI